MGDDTRLRAVVELAQAMAAATSLPDVAHAAAERSRAAMAGSFAAVSAWERERGRLRVLVNTGELAPGEVRFPADESYPIHDFPEVTEFLHERWSRGGEPQAWLETADGRRTGPSGRGGPGPAQIFGGRAAALRRRGRGCCVVAPIVLHGRAWGELYVARGPRAPVFDRDDTGFAAVLAAVTAAGVVQHERLEEVRRLAFTDPLTGLANRRAVDARLDHAVEEHRRSGTVISLVVCDLNGLKRVNDTHGHTMGDRLLERFGSALSLCGAALPGTLAARLGGDEFCLIAVGPTAEEVLGAAREVCRRAAELELGDGVACGVASTGEAIGPVRSARRLFRLADAAQYRAKAARSAEPVVAGRAGPEDVVVRLADTVPEGSDRRTFRGRPGPAPVSARGAPGPRRDDR
ncbi:GGDEF domain-containing protein [Streptomyces sp. ACA25]|uniref:GGDEF domain-containing protein n=1 Tax=Streptomyces sp. ACA25 TaxID=3022596 RepID=UPI002307D460|nr:GGDEF domain-containing protein [Streptomyces sp. ACA25]MDB1087024.1 GGDEF domain-containing protein [Streptomyces sp. ACA25]